MRACAAISHTPSLWGKPLNVSWEIGWASMETLNGTWVRFGVFPALTPKIEFKLFKLFHQTTMALKFHAGLTDPLTFQSKRTVGEFGGLSYSLVMGNEDGLSWSAWAVSRNPTLTTIPPCTAHMPQPLLPVPQEGLRCAADMRRSVCWRRCPRPPRVPRARALKKMMTSHLEVFHRHNRRPCSLFRWDQLVPWGELCSRDITSKASK